MGRNLSIDIETFSSVPITEAGLFKYVQSPDFEVLLFAYSLDDGPVSVVDLASGEKIPSEIGQLLTDPNCLKYAYNAAFEWYCLARYAGMTEADTRHWLGQWRCTQLHGLYCGYPSGLAAIGPAIGLPPEQLKLSTGKALIRTFSIPRKPTKNNKRTRTLPEHEPEKWALFKEYCVQDVVTEMEVERQLAPWPVPADIQQQWELDQIINLRGVAVDMDLVAGAIRSSETINKNLMDEAVQLTGLENPNSIEQLRGWLESETGIEVPNLQKGTVRDMLDGDGGTETSQRVLEIRQELGKTSIKKYDAMAAAVCADGRVRGILQFYGANRTGRWAGRIIQPQNLPRTHLDALDHARELVKDGKLESLLFTFGNAPDALSQLIRTALVPAADHYFVDADFSAIEARVLSWLADEEWRLEVFRTHGKIYEASASQMFGVPLEKIVKGNPEYALRQRGKVAELALGYQGSTNALTDMDYDKVLTEEEKPGIVDRWREANPRIKALWYEVQNAAMATVRTGEPSRVKCLIFELTGDTNRSFLTIQLPSGRKLFYVNPHISPGRFGDALHYYGLSQGKNSTSKKWRVLDTYGGKLVENIVQAIARDCLAEVVTRLEANNYPVVFHVHDEVVIEMETRDARVGGCLPREDLDTEKCSPACPHQNKCNSINWALPPDLALKRVCEIMAEPMPWAPDLLLGADGWTGSYYTKD